MKHRRFSLRLCALMTALIGLFSGCAVQEHEAIQTNGTTEASDTLHIYCFSAGKADAFLLYTGTSAVLIDCGESGFGKTIVAKLEELGITRLDYLIITHFDKDHVGGAKKVLSSIEVGTVLQSNYPKDASAYHNYISALEALGLTAQTLRETLRFTLDGVSYTVDAPLQEEYAEDPSNNSSLIISVEHGQARLLFAGDAEDARLSEFLAEDPGSYDFLKVPYHGHWQSILGAFFQTIQPRYAVITSSEKEPEDDKTTVALQDVGAEVFLTRNAPVLVISDGSSLSVSYTQ